MHNWSPGSCTAMAKYCADGRKLPWQALLHRHSVCHPGFSDVALVIARACLSAWVRHHGARPHLICSMAQELQLGRTDVAM